MATFQWVSTRRLAQLTGDYDPEQLPHFNWTGAWGVEGVDLGANTDHEGALHFYFGDVPQPDRSWPPYDADLMAFARHPPKDPGQLVLEPVRSGDLFYPVTVTDQYTAPPGAHLATAHQVAGQLDVFYIGRDGALWVVWVNDRQLWHSPVPIAPSGIAPPGGGVAAAFQTDDQLDVFYVGYDGALYVSWVVGGANWQGPWPVMPAGTAPPGAGVAAARQNSGQLEVFVIGRDGAVHVAWVVGGENWQTPSDLTLRQVAPAGGEITAIQHVPGEIDVFYIGFDGAAYDVTSPDDHTRQPPPPVAITPPNTSLAGSSVTAALQLSSQLDVFLIANDGTVQVAWRPDATNWQGPAPLPGAATQNCGLAAAPQGPDQLDLFYVGHDGGVYVDWVPGGELWRGPYRIAPPDTIASDQQHVFYRAGDGHIHHVFLNARTNSLHHDVWTALTGAPPAAGDPATMVYQDQQHIFYRDVTGHISHIFWDAPTDRLYHDRWTEITRAPLAVGDPATMVWRDQQHIFYRDGDGHIGHIFRFGQGPTGMAHDRWTEMQHAPLAVGDPATMVFRDQQHIFYRDADGHIDHIFWWGPTPKDMAYDRWTEMTRAPLAAGDPATMVWRDQQHIFYRDAQGQIDHIFWWGPTPRDMAVDQWTSMVGGASPAAGDPATMVYRNQQHIFYRDGVGRLHHIFWWGPTPKDIAHDDWTALSGAPPAAGDPTTMVFLQQQQHVFYRGADGALNHIFWFGPNPTDIAADRWSTPGIDAPAAAGNPATMVTSGTMHLAADMQVDDLLDVFFVGRDLNLQLAFVVGGGDWQNPFRVFDWMSLSRATPCGAFSYDGSVHVFLGHEGSVGMASTSRPRDPVPLEWRFEIVGPGSNDKMFFQVAPCVLLGETLPGPMPPTTHADGLIMFGHGWGANGFGVYLAWMPLWRGWQPNARDIWYFRGGADPWSPRPGDARALFLTRFGWTSLSVGRIKATGDWILLYQKTGQIEDNQREGTWNEGIIARIAPTPWEIAFAPETPIFLPLREGARGRFMSRRPDPPDDPGASIWPPISHPSFVYGAYLLNRYTVSDVLDDFRVQVKFNYLMSTGHPYQVQVMETVLIIDRS